MEIFTVRHASPFEIDDVSKILGEYHTWNDAVIPVFDAINRENMVITESSNNNSKSYHTFRFNEDGIVVFVDHFCNDDNCKYNNLELLNK